MAFNWKNRNVTYKHVNISTLKITKDTPWYNQLGAVLADSTSQTNDSITYVDGVLIFNKKLKGDQNKRFLILRIGIKEKLKLNVDADILENNRIFIKFYRVMPPKASPAATQNLRLMYAVEDPGSSEHQKEFYNHPEMIEVNEDGTFELPIGDYGRRGWEIIYVSKLEELYKYLYRYNNEPYLPIDNLTIDFSNNGKLVKKDEVEKVTQPDKNNMCEYKIPYFGIQDRSIIGTGYYGNALYENNNFQTKNKVKPFNSTQPQYWNLSIENYEIIYDGSAKQYNDNSLVTLSHHQSSLLLNVDGQTTLYSLNPKDKVLIYVRKPGVYKITKPIPYHQYKYTADADDSDLLKKLNQTGVVDICHERAGVHYYSNVSGTFSSTGIIDFSDKIDILPLEKSFSPFNPCHFSTTRFPFWTLGFNNIPLTSLDHSSDLYKFYSHIITNQIVNFNFSVKWQEDPGTDYNCKTVFHKKWNNGLASLCSISDQISFDTGTMRINRADTWTGSYTLNLKTSIPTLTNHPIQILNTNFLQRNTFIKPDNLAADNPRGYSVLNYIRLGGEITSVTAGIIDRVSSAGLMGIIGDQDSNKKNTWTYSRLPEICIFNYKDKDGNYYNWDDIAYYFSESQKTINSNVTSAGQISIPKQCGLKSWIGWSTQTLPTSYAIWVVIWRWSNKTN